MGLKSAFISFLKVKEQLPFDKNRLAEKNRTYIKNNL
jgi:hypothetical protein